MKRVSTRSMRRTGRTLIRRQRAERARPTGLVAIVCAAGVSMLSAGAGSADATVVGRIVGVGFPLVGDDGEGRDIVRVGAWVPVVVDLSLKGQASFDGWVRVAQPDKDGDLCHDMQRVHLMGQTPRRYWLYIVAPAARGPLAQPPDYAIEVLGAGTASVVLASGGRVVRALRPQQAPDTASADEYVVLSLSKRSVGKVARLADSRYAETFAKDIRITHIDPSRLPGRWQGLEMVDAVVWDDADPGDLTAPQLDALLTWTRFGGHLVVAAGRTADAVARSKLAGVLPVELGRVTVATELPVLRETLMQIEQEDRVRFDSPVTVVTCRARPGATRIVDESHPRRTIIARCRVGRGRVTFIAAALRDLLRGLDGDPVERLFTRVLELREATLMPGAYGSTSLFEVLSAWVGFTQVGAAFLAVAMIFAGLYVVAATFGSWKILCARGLSKHSWSLFGIVAAAASLASVVGVQAVRGVGSDLAQLTVVDAEANRSAAHATVYFGLKTGMFGRRDVWLAPDYPQVTEPAPTDCYLKPLPVGAQPGADKRYADPSRYRLMPARAEILDVSVRGTLKQFEGRWAGTLPGQLRAHVTLMQGPGGRRDRRISPESRITNELGVDLYDCYVIYVDRDVFLPGRAVQAARRPENIYLFRLPVPELANGGTFIFGDALYTDRKTGQEMAFEEWASVNTLASAQRAWSKLFDRIGLRRGARWRHLSRTESALLMLTTLAEYTPQARTTAMGQLRFRGSAFSAERCRHLDMSDLLDRGTALFVGFSHRPGPVTFCARRAKGAYRRVAARHALTMYRILIPLTSGSDDST